MIYNGSLYQNTAMVNLMPCIVRAMIGVSKTIVRASSGKKYLIIGKFLQSCLLSINKLEPCWTKK